MDYTNSDLGKIIKQQRIKVPLTLQELAAEFDEISAPNRSSSRKTR